MENIGHLAAAVLVTAFDDLNDNERTRFIYPQFFFTDLCKMFFNLSGVVYDREKIIRMIEKRPRPDVMFDSDTYTQKISIMDAERRTRNTYLFEVVDGYIYKISRHGIVYRLEHCQGKDDECNYIADVAFDRLRSGRYVLREGV